MTKQTDPNLQFITKVLKDIKITKNTDKRLPLLKDLATLMVKHKMIRFQIHPQWCVIIGENEENDSKVRLNPNESFDLDGIMTAITDIVKEQENTND